MKTNSICHRMRKGDLLVFTFTKNSHREFLVKHDMPLRCVVIYNKFPFKTYYAREVMGAI